MQTSRVGIPTDVFYHILEYARVADIPILCRLNSSFYPCARNFLYSDISHENAIDACRTIIAHQHLAPLVRSFELPRHAYLPEAGYEEILQCALSLMTNLARLKLLKFGAYPHVLDNCHHLTLRVFHSDLVPDVHLARFVRSQINLTELWVEHASLHWGDFSDPYLLPNLNTLRAPLSAASTLTVGRPIKDLTITSQFPDRVPSFLKFSTVPIERLKVYASLFSTIPSDLLEDVFPKLKHLALDFRNDAVSIPSKPWPWFLSAMGTMSSLQSCSLIGLQSLEHFVYSGRPSEKNDLFNFLLLVTATSSKSLLQFTFHVVYRPEIVGRYRHFTKVTQWRRNGDLWLETQSVQT